MTRKKTVVVAAAAVVALIAVLAAVLIRQRVRRHRVFRPAAGEVKPAPPQGIPPVEQWTATFISLEGEELAELLAAIETKHPDLYKKYSLGYLHARALLEDDEGAEAARRLEPFLAKEHPFRDRALYHRASLAEGPEASRFRTALIFEHRDSMYRDEAIDDELAYLAGKPQELLAFAEKIAPSASTERRREISARIVEATGSLDRGLAVLKGGIGDDAADRVTRALDKPAITQRLSTEQLELFGETFQRHRHYDRAIAYLNLAIGRLTKAAPQKAAMLAAVKKKKKAPPKAAKKPTAPPRGGLKPALRLANPRKRIDELEFALGRSYFGAERYAEAQNIYLRGARATPDPGMKCMFLWHAARSAQLRGDDKTAEQLMTQSIAVKGKFPSTTAALTQRIRTRLKQRRFTEAAGDLVQLRKMAGNERAVLEGSLAYAVGMLAAGNTTAALSALNSVPPNLRDDYDDAELAYWRARALEQRDPPAAFRAYLEVLRSDAPSHFAYFARKRLDSPAMASKLARELALREQQVAKHVAAKQFDLARRIQTDRILLSSRDRQNQLRKLADIYRQLPVYQDVLALKPAALPSFPDADGPAELLMAMGLHDEAAETIEQRWGLRPARAALTRSYALNLGGASKQSIYAIEVMMKAVPADFHPELLPEVVRRLLYPRYFYDFIAGDARRYEADPTLVLSIMREESRFNPRAKSQAAARGLLQFIITTARDIGRDVGLVDVDPEDLYDPRVIIQLGAKYISELGGQFGGNRYRVAAAYNAGPKQVALWNRIQAGNGDDYFLTAVNFDETKHYVRKVMNSYERYRSIYGDAAPVGGLRVEP
ncbi:MAG TPA: lytic transglycosylase domain-containing protein [Thermoanaerobaculia bacterium]|nr:lytic transglycosylase domain-containing protein [Thermoanaerobaculia bacterium]